MPTLTAPPARNVLYYGDNLPILRQYLADESVDLIYLDPPFNSNRSYNVLYREESGDESAAQITAFDDSWHWGIEAERLYTDLVTEVNGTVGEIVSALRSAIGPNQMLAYLVMMAARLVELRRVLKPTGSLYLHCDPTASHYLKIVLDAVFGAENFRNEIVWQRQSAHSDAKTKFPNVADIILFYGKSNQAIFIPQYSEHDPEYLQKFYRFNDNDGRGPYRLGDISSPNPRPNMMYEWLGFAWPVKGWRFQRETMQKLHDDGRIYYPRFPDGRLDTTKRPAIKRYQSEQAGSIVTNIWDDILPLHSSHAERLGYPTQKPVALLERILQASSKPGDVVLDPFCGCGTTIAAAQRLGRSWIGIDITHLSINLMKYRLRDAFGLAAKRDYDVLGEPEDVPGARQLAQDDRFQFQIWALGLVAARTLGDVGKKGGDRGIDGVAYFIDDASKKAKRVVVQVKSGRVEPAQVRDLRGVLDREGAALALFVTLEAPSREMLAEAAGAGFYHSPVWNQDYPRLQILTIEALLEGAQAKMPPSNITFKQAPRERGEGQSGTTAQTQERLPDVT